MTEDPAEREIGLSRSTTVLAGAATIAAVTIAARVLGFVRVVVFARTVGPTCLGDVYTTANTIPNIVFDIVAGGALSGLVVPVLASHVAADDRERTSVLVSALLTWVFILLVPIAVAGGLLATPLMSLLVGGGHGSCGRSGEVATGAAMLRIFAPQIVLYGLGIVLTGVLQARRRFFGPAIAPLLSSVVVIATYLGYLSINQHTDLSTHLQSGTALLAVGTTLGVFALALPLAIPALRGLRIRPRLRLGDGVGGTVARLALSGAAVLASQQVAAAVVLREANANGAAGAVVAWNLGWAVFLLPWAVLAVPVGTSAFPVLSVSWQEGNRSGFDALVLRTTRIVIVAMMLATAALVAVCEPASRVLIAGAPGELPPSVLARTLVGFAIGLPAYGVMAHLTRVRFARNDPRSPAMCAAVGWACAIAAVVVSAPRVPSAWVPADLAFGASLGMWISTLGLAALTWRDLSEHGRLPRTTGTSVLAALVAAPIGLVATNALPAVGPVASAGVAVLGGGVALAAAAGVITALDRDLARVLVRRLRA